MIQSMLSPDALVKVTRLSEQILKLVPELSAPSFLVFVVQYKSWIREWVKGTSRFSCYTHRTLIYLR